MAINIKIKDLPRSQGVNSTDDMVLDQSDATRVIDVGTFLQGSGVALKEDLASSTGAASIGTADGSTIEESLLDIREEASRSTIFTQPSAGTAERSTLNKMRDSVSIKDFGAVGDGVTDDTLAFQSAATFCCETGSDLILTPGVYLISSTITSKPFMIRGFGGKILANNMSNMTIFDMTTPIEEIGRVAGCRDIEWIVKGASITSAVKGPLDGSQYSTYFLRYEFVGNRCRGYLRNTSATGFAWDHGAASWFSIGDCVGVEISNNNIQGRFNITLDPSSQPAETAFTLNAASAILSARVHDNNIGPIKTGFTVSNRTFMTFHDNDLIGTYDGLVWKGTSLYNEPKVYNNNFNSQRYGIYMDGIGSIMLSGNTIRRHRSGWKNSTSNWYGLYLTNGTDLKITDNTIQADESDGAFPLSNIALFMDGCSLCNTTGNFIGANSDIGVGLNNCTGICIDNTLTAQSGPTDILFNLTGNTRLSTIGQYITVSTFSGTVLQKDASVTSPISMMNSQFDLQSTGNVTMDMTRSSNALDSKKWRTTVSSSQLTRSVVNDSGSSTNYELITRSGSTISELQWRAPQFRFNNGGPLLITGSGSPEGISTAGPGSLFLRTGGGANATLYVKETGTGNTGWVAK